MQIQLNADKNLSVHEAFAGKLESILEDQLSRFSEHITRLEVHLSDENGAKEGVKDKKCLLEARIRGRQPIAVTETGDTHEQTVNGAIDKLKASLDTILGRMRKY